MKYKILLYGIRGFRANRKRGVDTPIAAVYSDSGNTEKRLSISAKKFLKRGRIFSCITFFRNNTLAGFLRGGELWVFCFALSLGFGILFVRNLDKVLKGDVPEIIFQELAGFFPYVMSRAYQRTVAVIFVFHAINQTA